MKKVLLFIIPFSLFSLPLSAQRHGIKKKVHSENYLFLTAGPSYFFGDTGSSKKSFLGISGFDIHNTRYLLSGGFSQIFNDRGGYRISAQYGNYTGTDDTSYLRGYAHNTDIIQGNLEGQYIFLRGGNSKDYYFYRLYATAGIGIAHSITERTGNLIQSDNQVHVSETTAAIPVGIGIDFRLSPKVVIGAEVRANYFLSDNMEGLSPKTSKNNDLTGSLLFVFSYSIWNSENKYPCRCSPD